MRQRRVTVALAGQPNCGKSTVFNALTGASQHVANYPGVTVEKMTGTYKQDGAKVEVVDLPGTYSLTSYSLEERVTRDFLLNEKPAVVIDVADASNLKRNLYLTFQLLEMEIPVVIELNMMDVAKRRNIEINIAQLSRQLGVPVIPTVIKTGKGKKELLQSVAEIFRAEKTFQASQIDYGNMEPFLRDIKDSLSKESRISKNYPLRWFAVKLMENDSEALNIIRKNHSSPKQFLKFVEEKRQKFQAEHKELPGQHISVHRYLAADTISKACVKTKKSKKPLSDSADAIICNRYLGPLILVGVIYMLYYLSIVQGYNLTNYTWPLLAKIRSITEAIMPDPEFIKEPLIRSLSLWFVDSINALLNYIPIFFILFGLIAILEDTGYMPRMAFILDRLFHRFGLHGQSTLPMVLGGIYVGGCAVPGVMSTKGIPDERSRLATILIIPMLNCLAKVPLYVLMINIYFADHKGIAMFFISTISLLIVLPTAKILTLTVLKNKETAPFIMEMPPYHVPTIRGVLGRAVERVWLFIRKIITIVAAVAVIIFVLLQFPGISDERETYYAKEKEKAVAKFYKTIKTNPYAEMLHESDIMALVIYWDRYKSAKRMASGEKKTKAVNEKFEKENSYFFKIVQPKKDKDAKKVKHK